MITEDLKTQLEELRSLLGPQATNKNWPELVECMAQICLDTLKTKKFGKRRMEKERSTHPPLSNGLSPIRTNGCTHSVHEKSKAPQPTHNSTTTSSSSHPTPTSELHRSKSPRHIGRALRYEVWKRDKGRCLQCGSQRNVQVDHIKPVALGGLSQIENLRLLCFHCNQRQSIKVFGFN